MFLKYITTFYLSVKFLALQSRCKYFLIKLSYIYFVRTLNYCIIYMLICFSTLLFSAFGQNCVRCLP